MEQRGLPFLQPPDRLPAAQLLRSDAFGHAELSQRSHHRTVPVLAAGSKREPAGRSRGGRLESAPGTFRDSWGRSGTAAEQVFDAEIAELEDHEVLQREVTAAVPSVDSGSFAGAEEFDARLSHLLLYGSVGRSSANVGIAQHQVVGSTPAQVVRVQFGITSIADPQHGHPVDDVSVQSGGISGGRTYYVPVGAAELEGFAS